MADLTPSSLSTGSVPPATPAPSGFRVRHAFLIFFLLLAFAAIGLAWYASTPQFAERVRREVVARLETATGGAVELKSFHWNPWHLAVEIDDLTIHGLEAPGDIPYAHLDRLLVRARILSFLLPRISLSLLHADHPVFHLITYPDGTTNQPRPRTQTSSGGSPVNTLFDLAVDRTEVSNGLFVFNQRSLPFELAARELGVTVTYVPASKPVDEKYHADLAISDFVLHMQQNPPVHSRLTLSADLARTAATVNALDWKTGESVLAASGTLANFSNPQWSFVAKGQIDLREVGMLAGLDTLRHGTADLDLQGHGISSFSGDAVSSATAPVETAAAPAFEITGHARAREVSYADPFVRVAGATADTPVRITERDMSFSGFTATLADGGMLHGQFRILNWLGTVAPAPEKPAAKAAAIPSRRSRFLHPFSKPADHKEVHTVRLKALPSQPHGIIDAEVSRISLRTVLEAVAPPHYADLGFDTAAGGSAHAEWLGNADSISVAAKLGLAPTGRSSGVPVSGSIDARYENSSNKVFIASVVAQTPASRLNVGGVIGVVKADGATMLNADLTTSNLGEFDRVLTVVGLQANGKTGTAAIPVHLDGAASFHGTVSGALAALDVKGHVDTGHFATVFDLPPGQASASQASASQASAAGDAAHPSATVKVPTMGLPTAQGGRTTIEWDSLHADAEYAPSQLIVHNATLTRGRTVLHADGTLRPHPVRANDYAWDERTAINANARIENAPLEEIEALGGVRVPITGVLNLNLNATGTLGGLHGGGHLALAGGAAYGEPYKSLNTDIRFAGREIGLANLSLLENGGSVTGEGGYDYGARTFHLDVKGSGFELAHFKQLQGGKYRPGGALSFSARGSGALLEKGGLRDSNITAKVQLSKVTLGAQPVGEIDADLHTKGNTLFLTSRSELSGAVFQATGQVGLSGDFDARAQVGFTGFNIDPLIQAFAPASGVKGRSAIAGRIELSGPLQRPRDLEANANIEKFSATISNVDLESQGPVKVSLRDGTLTLDQAHITGKDTDLVAEGSATLSGDRELDMRAKGTVNVALAQSFDPDLIASGHVDFTVDAGGTLDKPDLEGQVKFINVAVGLQDIPNGLSQVNGTLVFDQDRLAVQQLTAQSGGGQLILGGSITYHDGIYADLTATGKDVRVRYEGISASGNANLHLQGNQQNLLLSGNVLVTRFGLGSNFDIASLASSAGGGVAALPDPAAASNHIRLDIRIESAPSLDFQNSFARLAGDVNLHLVGTLGSPSLLGRVLITEGNATFAGTKYQLNRGDIYFTNPVRIEPVIDLDATARVSNYDVTIGLHGPASKLQITYRSEPPLSETDVFALLALGRTQEQAQIYQTQQQQAGADSTTDALLGGALNATVSNRVQRLFGVGSVKVDPTFVGSLGNSTARITVEQQVASNVTLTYASNVNSTAQQLIQLQYDINKNVSLVAVRDENDVFSVVVKVRRRKR